MLEFTGVEELWKMSSQYQNMLEFEISREVQSGEWVLRALGERLVVFVELSGAETVVDGGAAGFVWSCWRTWRKGEADVSVVIVVSKRRGAKTMEENRECIYTSPIFFLF